MLKAKKCKIFAICNARPQINLNDLVKSQKSDGTVIPPWRDRCKARESLGMRRTYQYVAMTKDEAQSRLGGTDGLFTKPSILI
jgi:hypothetical protein